MPDHAVPAAAHTDAGTASKTLAPGLRLGSMVLSRHLVDDVAAAEIAADRGSAVSDQLAFADFLARGELDRHLRLRRMRPVHRRRRNALLAALRARVPDLQPTGISAGFRLVAWLPPDLDEESVVTAAAERGLGVYEMAQHRMSADVGEGLVFGYAGLAEPAIAEGVDIPAAVLADLRTGKGTGGPRQQG